MQNNVQPTRQSRNDTNAVATTAKKSTSVKKVSNKSVSAKRAVRAPRVVNVNKKDKAPFPWSIVMVAVLFTTLFLFMMMNYAEVDKYRSEIAELDGRIATMQKNQDELEVTLSNKHDLNEIGEYAASELGMVPGSQIINRKVITIDQDDRTEMNTYDDGEEGGFGFLLSGFGEVFRDFFD